ncbi:hypothetical protein [Cupriavidus plantarum]|nr:hypothetical protein [Cupriavidus plantarum]RLK45561.1 hypothetical protein C7417_1580 [Cupriavidus plantarum]
MSNKDSGIGIAGTTCIAFAVAGLALAASFILACYAVNPKRITQSGG